MDYITRFLLLLVFTGVFVTCKTTPTGLSTYQPPVTFAGYLNGAYDSLTGNSNWPNTSTLVGDTVRLYFYSSDFSEENRIRKGDILRVDIWPGNDGPVLGNKTMFVNLSRYEERNATYTIHPSDPSIQGHAVRAQVNQLHRSTGSKINIENFFVSSQPVSGTNAPELKITKGTIIGDIE